MSNTDLHTSYTHVGNHPCSCILAEDHHQEELDDLKAESPDLFHNTAPQEHHPACGALDEPCHCAERGDAPQEDRDE